MTVVDDAVVYMTYERRGGLHELRLKYNISFSEAWRQLRPTVEDELILETECPSRGILFENQVVLNSRPELSPRLGVGEVVLES